MRLYPHPTAQPLREKLAKFHGCQAENIIVGNFLFVRPPGFAAEEWLRKLRDRKILVPWFPYRETRDYLRITIGREDEMGALVKAARRIL